MPSVASFNLVSRAFTGSVWRADVHRLYGSAVLGWHTRHQEPLWSRCMSGMPGWLAALQNTWPDDNTVTAECVRKKIKLHGMVTRTHQQRHFNNRTNGYFYAESGPLGTVYVWCKCWFLLLKMIQPWWIQTEKREKRWEALSFWAAGFLVCFPNFLNKETKIVKGPPAKESKCPFLKAQTWWEGLRGP